MKRLFFLLLICGAFGHWVLADDKPKPEASPDAAAVPKSAEQPNSDAAAVATAVEEPNPDAEAIQKAVDAYVTAFNAGDAAALSMLFSEHGEMFGPAGDRVQGRELIQKQFADYFAATKGAKIELEGIEIDVQSPSTAVETGLARVVVPDEEPSETLYRAVHVKTADGWRIDSVREAEPAPTAPSNLDKLQDLAWLVGNWASADDDGAQIESTIRWSRNNNFLIQSYRVLGDDDDGEVDFEGTQVIGWDPQAQTVRSWLFDSDGGFGAGRWSQGEGTWTVQSLQVLPDGRSGTAVNVYEQVDENTIQYRSTGRQVEGELLPGIGPVTVVRTN